MENEYTESFICPLSTIFGERQIDIYIYRNIIFMNSDMWKRHKRAKEETTQDREKMRSYIRNGLNIPVKVYSTPHIFLNDYNPIVSDGIDLIRYYTSDMRTVGICTASSELSVCHDASFTVAIRTSREYHYWLSFIEDRSDGITAVPVIIDQEPSLLIMTGFSYVSKVNTVVPIFI